MTTIDSILEKRGLNYDKLTAEERETYHQLNEALAQSALDMNKIRTAIKAMMEAVTKELVDEPEYLQVFVFKVRNLKNLHLKARLKNYMLIDALLTSPEKAQAQIERQLGAMVGGKVDTV